MWRCRRFRRIRSLVPQCLRPRLRLLLCHPFLRRPWGIFPHSWGFIPPMIQWNLSNGLWTRGRPATNQSCGWKSPRNPGVWKSSFGWCWAHSGNFVCCASQGRSFSNSWVPNWLVRINLLTLTGGSGSDCSPTGRQLKGGSSWSCSLTLAGFGLFRVFGPSFGPSIVVGWWLFFTVLFLSSW